MTEKEKELEIEKRNALRAAKQLCYSRETLLKLEAAKTVNELCNIMHDARKGKTT